VQVGLCRHVSEPLLTKSALFHISRLFFVSRSSLSLGNVQFVLHVLRNVPRKCIQRSYVDDRRQPPCLTANLRASVLEIPRHCVSIGVVCCHNCLALGLYLYLDCIYSAVEMCRVSMYCLILLAAIVGL